MRYNPHKAYPHPVLRPGSSDYPRGEFEVELTPERIADTTAMRIRADFALSDPDLLHLVDSKRAHYVLLVRATKTQHRSSHQSLKPQLRQPFPDGAIAGPVEARGLLVARQRLPSFRAEGWHDDYQGRTYDIPAGAVLAEDEPQQWEVDNAEEAPISSIFDQQAQAELKAGQWRCYLEGERVVLEMSPEDSRRFLEIRIQNEAPAVIMNSIYLPALTHVLYEAERSEAEYEGKRWFRSLNASLERRGLSVIGDVSDRLSDAQQLLDRPFANLLPTEESR